MPILGGEKLNAQVKEWISKVKKGCPSSYKPVVLFYQDKIYRHCFHMIRNVHEAEDITQETFLRAYIHIHTFDEQKKFSTWLFRIASNLTIDRIRKRKPDFYLDAEVKEYGGLTMYSQIASPISSPGDAAESRDLVRFLYEEIEKLPSIYKEVVILRFFHGLALQEISEIFELPPGTVKVRLFRARNTLKERISQYNEPVKQK